MNRDLYNTQWKLQANQKKLTSTDFAFRALLIAVSAKNLKNVPREDIALTLLQRYFTPSKTDGYATLKNILDRIPYYLFEHTKILGLKAETFITETEFKAIQAMAKNLNLEKLGRQYVYYFTRQDGLTPEQQGVQAGHALFKLGAKLGKQGKNFDPSEIYFQWIGVKTSQDLTEVSLNHLDHRCVEFYEPDLGNSLTSIAFEPILWNERDEFMEYDLLTHYGNIKETK